MEKKKELHVLFVCKYNRFRSKLAEAYFRKINKNKNIKSKSAGIFRGKPIDKGARATARENGFRITGRPRTISEKLLKWSDIIVIVADNVPKSLFEESWNKKRKTIALKIRDSYSEEDNSVVAQEIKKAIEEFYKNLEII